MSEYIITIDDSRADYDGNTPITAKEEITRCRDCKYYAKWDALKVKGYKCMRPSTAFSIELDGFCAWGESKGESE